VLETLRTAEQRVESEGLFAVGFLSYESSPAFDSAYPVFPPGGFPLAWFALYRPGSVIARQELPPSSGHYRLGAWVPTIDREEYQRNIDAIRERIREGDTYQVNHTYRLRAPFSGDSLSYFRTLENGQETPYAAWIDTGQFTICSVSPELFFRLDGDTLTSRPMKGTARRGLTVADDHERGTALRDSEKDKAENVMIVDMVRNDIGRVATEGSVIVSELFTLEKYPTVWQLTSTVIGKTRQGVPEVMRALFPAASITGAPKARTMGIIRELETTPRNLYTGALGWLRPGRRACFSVAIRTVVIDGVREEAEYGIGGGITWGSTGEEEYEETRTKALVVGEETEEFQLLETLLWTPAKGFAFLREHLDRLCATADYFSFPCSTDVARTNLGARAAAWDSSPRRVRLLLSRRGVLTIEASPLEIPHAGRKPRVRPALSPVSTANRFLYHKTTRRWMYEGALAAQPGCDDVILWNERGEVTESTIANLILDIRGRLFTPPVSSGLLPGISRAALLRAGTVEERVCTRKDLASADRVLLANSVRGPYEVEFIPDP
jgi:para-aminobenzoate synthetase/4-amino-4-deoxychorismate lyase